MNLELDIETLKQVDPSLRDPALLPLAQRGIYRDDQAVERLRIHLSQYHHYLGIQKEQNHDPSPT